MEVVLWFDRRYAWSSTVGSVFLKYVFYNCLTIYEDKNTTYIKIYKYIYLTTF